MGGVQISLALVRIKFELTENILERKRSDPGAQQSLVPNKENWVNA